MIIVSIRVPHNFRFQHDQLVGLLFLESFSYSVTIIIVRVTESRSGTEGENFRRQYCVTLDALLHYRVHCIGCYRSKMRSNPCRMPLVSVLVLYQQDAIVMPVTTYFSLASGRRYDWNCFCFMPFAYETESANYFHFVFVNWKQIREITEWHRTNALATLLLVSRYEWFATNRVDMTRREMHIAHVPPHTANCPSVRPSEWASESECIWPFSK